MFSFLKNLFNNNDSCEADAYTETYKGFEIIATPKAEGSQFRINGSIKLGEKETPFIRADLLPDAQSCTQETVRKAKIMIDQQGDSLFS
jgi:hypothetical protein